MTKVTYLEDESFLKCTSLNSINLSNVLSFGCDLFNGCRNLLKVLSFPKFQSTILDGFFSDCNSLNEVNLDFSDVEYIKNNCFYRCYNISMQLNLQNIKSIGSQAFYQCRLINSLIIGSDCINIDETAFNSCISLKYIKMLCKVPPVLNADNVFANSSCYIYVPDDSIPAYKSATNWVTYSSRIKPISTFTK